MLIAVLLTMLVSSTIARYHDSIKLFAQVNKDIKGASNPAEHSINYWNQKSIETIQERRKLSNQEKIAKNVILFLGDGMSIATITAGRVLMGQLQNKSGEEQVLSFEKFPYTGLSKTYCVDSQVADSACTATAYLSGVKTNIRTIGVTADVRYKDWKAMLNQSLHTTSILQWAQDAGKGTGIVTTCRVTDASPTGTYAHTANRNWQTDQDILKDVANATGIPDIASQLIESTPGKNIKVILGGGREVFLPKDKQDGYGYSGLRGDGKDLLARWQTMKDTANVNGKYVNNRSQLLNTDINSTDYLLGLFHHSHMEYRLRSDPELQPTLMEMTSVAIKMMQKEANGYFLFIEGGLIDHGHHENRAHLALDETVEFHKAIELAVNMTSEADTLIVVTADHAHTLTFNGYPTRGSDIFTTLQSTADNLTYSTLSYANGPNTNRFNEDLTQHNISLDDRGHFNYTFPTIYKLGDETHDGQDVAVYARGPCAHLLSGNYEQNLIPHVMGYAARIGPTAVIDMRSAGWPTSATGVSWLLLLVALLAINYSS